METTLSDTPDQNQEKDISSLLQNAMDLSHITLTDSPPDILCIANHDGCQITVTDASLGAGATKFLFIYKLTQDGRRQILHRSTLLRNRAILFVACVDTFIIIHTKMLKISYLYCRDGQTSIRGGCIGPVEFIRCENVTVDIRVFPLSVVQVDLSRDISFYQRIPEVVYALHGCENVVAAIVPVPEGGVFKKVGLVSSVLGEQSFTAFSLEGVVVHQRHYILNGMVQEILYIAPEELREAEIFKNTLDMERNVDQGIVSVFRDAGEEPGQIEKP